MLRRHPLAADEAGERARDAADAEDVAVETDGTMLVVDPVSLDLVRGSSVDFVESLGGSIFQVTNPQAASGCGCGTSFSV